ERSAPAAAAEEDGLLPLRVEREPRGEPRGRAIGGHATPLRASPFPRLAPPLASLPPKSSVPPRSSSNTIDAALNGTGPLVATRSHRSPSNSHVSPDAGFAPRHPPAHT